MSEVDQWWIAIAALGLAVAMLLASGFAVIAATYPMDPRVRRTELLREISRLERRIDHLERR
ncbi:hypothetical protein MICRO8M_20070 [Microbacterium sp. 8M]|uniref:hypothetical protein n=1 Tax=Microbacterium sp. 8M TaxID=2653153 RepID=UPI0012F10083|nr:hypothetical protein [Microbacterium sp. 8M]VXB54090.1 hypothetical protein MICRO8M_20070 [Microbacterium sp. 8M]